MNKDINLTELSNKAFSIIELVQLAIPDKEKFKIIRKKLLDLANDIKRLSGEEDGT